MNWKDQRVVRAMGEDFETLRLLAVKLLQHPELALDIEREVGKILERKSPVERAELRAALLAARRK